MEKANTRTETVEQKVEKLITKYGVMNEAYFSLHRHISELIRASAESGFAYVDSGVLLDLLHNHIDKTTKNVNI